MTIATQATAPITNAEVTAPLPIDPASIGAPPADEAARKEIQPPEHTSSAPAVNDAAIMPPTSPKLPKPPVNNVATSMGETTNDTHLIEKNIAQFIADRLPPEMRPGLMVDFEESPSNKVTSEGHPEQGLRDVSVTFKGGKLESPAMAQQLAEQLSGALREHPAFQGMSVGGIDQQMEHEMRCQILALEPERFNTLLQPQPRVNKTFITDATQAADEKITVNAKAIEQALAQYLGERLEASQKEGVNLKVEAIAQSNAVTARDPSKPQFDILMNLEGGVHSTTRDHKIRELLRHHPVLSKSHLEINEVASNAPEGGQNLAITVRAMGLNTDQLVALTQAQTLQTGTPLAATPTATHACTGANCSHCDTHKEVTEAAAPAIAEKPAHEHHQASLADHAAHAPHAAHADHHVAAHADAAHTPAVHPHAAHTHEQAAAHHPAAVTPHAAPVAPDAAAHAQTSAAAAVTSVVPPMTQVASPTPIVDTPAHHKGITAANDAQHQLSA